MLLQLKGHADNKLKVTGRHSKTITFLIYHFEGYRVMAPRENKSSPTELEQPHLLYVEKLRRVRVSIVGNGNK